MITMTVEAGGEVAGGLVSWPDEEEILYELR